MSEILLSIIIPIYNGADHLRRTIDSVLSSGIDSFPAEVLLIDDGSFDNTASICNQFVKDYPTLFRYYYKDNGGQSSARNYGLFHAIGKYVYFLDDDDLLRPDSMGIFFSRFYDEKFDILGFSSDTVNDSSTLTIEKSVGGTVIFAGGGIEFLNRVIPTFVWVYWYRREFLLSNDLSFTINNPEDVMFNLMVFRLNPLALITSQKVICYMNYKEAGQLTKQRAPGFLRQVLSGYMLYFKELSNSRKTHNLGDEAVDLAIKAEIVPFTSRCLSSNLSSSEFRELKNRLEEMDLLDFNPPINKVARCCLLIIKTPLFFPLYQILYKCVFIKLILPKLSRS